MTYVKRYPNELYHHGIKGQKWGVRRFQDSSGKLTSAGKKRYKEYNKDYKEYKTLNRHVSAAQRHLKEEGIMLDRVRDKYQQADRNYRKEMMKSSGLFGLKAAKKADRVARAQNTMDEVGKDYDAAANSYGYANKIAKKDRKALSDHINKMVDKYGKGSVKEIEYETVKIGQNKLQKIMQGAPISSVFGRTRETDVYVKTGKTVADMPIIGNWYTANYTSDAEWKMKRSEIERTRDSSSAKRKSGDKAGKYIKKEDYFDGVSSIGKTKREREAEKKARAKAEKKAKAKAEKKAEADIEKRIKKNERKQEKAEKKNRKKLDKIKEYNDESLKRNAADNRPNSGTAKTVPASRQLGYTDKQNAIDMEYDPKTGQYKKRRRDVYHSATFNIRYSDELYHHGIKGQKWGVRRFQNKNGQLTAKGKERYYKYGSPDNAAADKKIRRTNRRMIGAAISVPTVMGVGAGVMTKNKGATAAINYSSFIAAGVLATIGQKKISKLEFDIDDVKDAKAITKEVKNLNKMSPKERAKFYQKELNAYDKWEAASVKDAANLSKEYIKTQAKMLSTKSQSEGRELEAELKKIENKARKQIEARNIYEDATHRMLAKLEKDKDLVYMISNDYSRKPRPSGANYYDSVKGNRYKVRRSNTKRQDPHSKWQWKRHRYKYTPIHTEYYYY